MNTSSLADLAPGLADPVHDAQRVFRRLLDAMSRPGRLQSLGAGVVHVNPPQGLGAATAAVLLTVADPDLRVWFSPNDHTEAQTAWLRFHTGARIVETAGEADWLVLSANDARPTVWSEAGIGTDEAPHTSATLLLEVPSLAAAPGLHLTGPGIEHRHSLDVGGVDTDFWEERRAREHHFPRGADLVLTCGPLLAALPRSTRIALED